MFATVGFREKPFRPIPIDDLTDILDAAVNGRMPRQTVAVVGAEQLLLSEGRAVRGILAHQPLNRGISAARISSAAATAA